jgi:hypothetical protein
VLHDAHLAERALADGAQQVEVVEIHGPIKVYHLWGQLQEDAPGSQPAALTSALQQEQMAPIVRECPTARPLHYRVACGESAVAYQTCSKSTSLNAGVQFAQRAAAQAARERPLRGARALRRRRWRAPASAWASLLLLREGRRECGSERRQRGGWKREDGCREVEERERRWAREEERAGTRTDARERGTSERRDAVRALPRMSDGRCDKGSCATDRSRHCATAGEASAWLLRLCGGNKEEGMGGCERQRRRRSERRCCVMLPLLRYRRAARRGGGAWLHLAGGRGAAAARGAVRHGGTSVRCCCCCTCAAAVPEPWRGVGAAAGRPPSTPLPHAPCMRRREVAMAASEEERTARLLPLPAVLAGRGRRHACLEQSAGRPSCSFVPLNGSLRSAASSWTSRCECCGSTCACYFRTELR